MSSVSSEFERKIEYILTEVVELRKLRQEEFANSIANLKVHSAVKQALASAFEAEPTIAKMQVAIIQALLENEDGCRPCASDDHRSSPKRTTLIEVGVEKRGCRR